MYLFMAVPASQLPALTSVPQSLGLEWLHRTDMSSFTRASGSGLSKRKIILLSNAERRCISNDTICSATS